MLEGITEKGFNYSINEEVLDDIELLEDFMKVYEGNIILVPKILEKILGETQKKELYNFYKNEGITKASDIFKVVEEIFSNDKKTKN